MVQGPVDYRKMHLNTLPDNKNTVGKGEIARYEQFLLFPQCFQKACFLRGVKRCHCVGMG